MSDTTTTATAPVVSDDPVKNALTAKAQDAASKANALADKYRAAKAGNPATEAKRIVEKADESDIPENVRESVLKFRAARDKALAAIAAQESKLTEHIVGTLPKSALTDDEVEALRTEHKSHVDMFKTVRKTLVDLDLLSAEEQEAFVKVKSLGGSGNSTGTHAGAGRPKPRFSEITVNGRSIAKTVDGKRVCTPTVLAETLNGQNDGEGWAKVTSGEIVDAVFAANGSQDLSEDVTLKSFRGKYDIVFTPKSKDA